LELRSLCVIADLICGACGGVEIGKWRDRLRYAEPLQAGISFHDGNGLVPYAVMTSAWRPGDPRSPRCMMTPRRYCPSRDRPIRGWSGFCWFTTRRQV
jgi:hypothetical protein